MKNRLLLSMLVAGLSLTVVSAASAQTFGGYATGAQVTVPATGTTIRAATGTLDPSGGTVDASLLVATIPGSLTGGAVSLSAGVMHSAASGLIATHSESSTADVSLTISGNQITADFLMARSAASCGPAVSGSAQVINLIVNSQPITVTGAPNQTVTLSNGSVVINEQSSSVSGSTATLTVTALHVNTRDVVTGQSLADAWVATLAAEIQCQGGGPSTATSTTGGGWFFDQGKDTFGFAGNVQDAGFSGHLEYNDHAALLTVHSTLITSVTTNGCTTRIFGNADSSSGPVTFEVDVTDAGEPGTGDSFLINVPELLYTRSGTLSGGNIQVHDHTCP
jgi:hypothetical protein